MSTRTDSPRGPEGGWAQDAWALSDDTALLPRLTRLLTGNDAAQTPWCAATTVLLGTDPNHVTSAYVQHVHELGWRVSEAALLARALPQLAARPSAAREHPWPRNHIAVRKAATLENLARLLAVPTPPDATWRAAAVITYMPSLLGRIRGQLWFLQHPRRPLPDQTLQAQAHTALTRRYHQEVRRTPAAW